MHMCPEETFTKYVLVKAEIKRPQVVMMVMVKTSSCPSLGQSCMWVATAIINIIWVIYCLVSSIDFPPGPRSRRYSMLCLSLSTSKLSEGLFKHKSDFLLS